MSRTVVLLIGCNGQLGSDLQRCWAANRPDDRVIGLSHSDIEVADTDSVRSMITRHRPTLVINTAAYHQVDAVETDPHRAFQVNAVGARNVAIACREVDAVLVHISTDYVFSGTAGRPYVEDDAVDAINVYGVSKAAGEMMVRHSWHRHFIVRTSGLYGVAGSSGKKGNFVETMLRLLGSRTQIRVVCDQTLTPTPTAPLSVQILHIIAHATYGTYHATCQGACSWYTFAAEIFRQSGRNPPLTPQTTAESGALAQRPRYSVLDNRALRTAGLDIMPAWKDALTEYLTTRTRNADGGIGPSP